VSGQRTPPAFTGRRCQCALQGRRAETPLPSLLARGPG
jgi:hypothetical protein